MDFKKGLSHKRIPVPTPDSLIDENGKAVFGTFDKEFKDLDLMKIKDQSFLPDFMNWFRIIAWEAIEVNMKDCVLLTANCTMGLLNSSITCFFDKRNGKLKYWKQICPLSNDIKVAKNLLDGNFSELKKPEFYSKCVNDFGNGKAFIEGYAKDKQADISFEMNLQRVCLPSVVSIPFGKNKPLYTQKDVFEAKGYIEVNGERFECDEEATAIIDDHKGFYPRRSHYDWVTTMGKKEIDGKKQYFAFNLTRNQSINQTDYNENLIWFEDRSSRLTPVRFEHITFDKWKVRDVYGMVDITYDIADRVHIYMPFSPIMKVDYHIVFGTLSGYVMDEEGNKYVVDGMTGIGEDKSMLY